MSPQFIPGNPNPGYIYKANNHIAVDCCGYHVDGRMVMLCLETGQEFNVE